MSERERTDTPGPRAAPPAGAARRAQMRRAASASARRLAARARALPKWALASAAVAALAVVASLLYFALRTPPGWTLVVRNAPPGGEVLVDDVRRGVTTDDGTVRVAHLRAGTKVVKFVFNGQESEARDWTGRDGELKPIDWTLSAPAEKLPEGIEYNGAMVLVPAGEFVMGANDREENERPAHGVALPDYYIDKYEVKNAQYKEFCEATPECKPPLNPLWAKERLGTDDYFNAFPDLPVIGVNWDEASDFCARGAGKRLPTEQEWEKAASWGPGANHEKRLWPWGNKFDARHANVGGQHPVRVTAFAAGASAYGVFNMAGNVSEWVESHYLPYPGNTGTGGIRHEFYPARYGREHRVTRGGTFDGTAETVRTTRRSAQLPTSRTRPEDEARKIHWLIGFRCAVSADDPRVQKFIGGGGQ